MHVQTMLQNTQYEEPVRQLNLDKCGILQVLSEGVRALLSLCSLHKSESSGRRMPMSPLTKFFVSAA